MAKSSGLGDSAFVAGYDLSGDICALSRIAGGPAALDVTAINKSAHERLGGVRTGEISFNTWMNTALLQEHVALSGLPTADVHLMYARGSAIGNPAACMICRQINYDWTRGADGSLQGAVQALSDAYGLEWATLLTAGLRTDTAATNGASQDDGSSSAFGAQAYLQVTGFSGTDVTIKIQDSANNSAWSDVSGFGFTQITSGNQHTERIAIANNATLREYVRAVTVTTGGFTSLSFVVAYVRNFVAGQVF